MKKGMLIEGLALSGHRIGWCLHAGQWLQSFDPDGMQGRGLIRTTKNPAEAMGFDTQEAAIACWQRQSRTVPLRDDGELNRPLTAYTCSIMDLPEPAAKR